METPWNHLRHRPGSREGHYESYYLRANHAERPLAFWIRYTIYSPRERPESALGELWAIVFNGETGRHIAVRQEWPLQLCDFDRERFRVRVGAARLDAVSLNGAAASGGHRLRWDLRYASEAPPLLLLQEHQYDAGFPAAKSVVSQPLAQFSGTLEVDGHVLAVDAWRGSQNHNWGRKHTDRYAFGQVCGFDNAPDSFLEVITARVKLGPLRLPPLTPMVLRHRGQEFAMTSIPQALRATGRYGDFRWVFASQCPGLRVQGEISATAADFVGLRYLNPPGGVKICHNTKIARCRLQLVFADGSEETLESKHGALLEILDDVADPQVPVSA